MKNIPPASTSAGSMNRVDVGKKKSVLFSKNDANNGYLLIGELIRKKENVTSALREKRVQYMAMRMPAPTKPKPTTRSNAPIFKTLLNILQDNEFLKYI